MVSHAVAPTIANAIRHGSSAHSGCALSVVMARRSVPSPSSALLVTVNVRASDT
jgi:hypothetical protein